MRLAERFGDRHEQNFGELHEDRRHLLCTLELVQVVGSDVFRLAATAWGWWLAYRANRFSHGRRQDARGYG